MKIAIVIDSFPKVSEFFIVTQIIGLLKKGHDVRIYSSNRTLEQVHPMVKRYNLISKTIFTNDVIGDDSIFKLIFKFCIKYPTSFVNILKYIFETKRHHHYINPSVFELGLIMPQQNFNVIHAHFGYNGNHIAKLKSWGVLKNMKFITTFHGCDFLPQLEYPNVYNCLFQESNTIVQVTDYAKQKAIELGFPQEKMAIVPCGLNEELFNGTSRKEYNNDKSLRLVFLGRLIPFKNPVGVIEICHQLQEIKIDFSCQMMGAGPLMETCRKKIAEYSLEEKIKMLGACTSDVVKEVFINSDLFLFPGIYDETGRAENQGCAVQEAQAINLPVLCTSAGGTHECVDEGRNGFILSNEDNYSQFVEKIIWLDNHRDELQRMGEAARTFVVEKYDNKKIIKQLENIYKYST